MTPQNILIATFSVWKDGQRTAINGMVEPLLSYFTPKAKNVDLIDGPHPGSNFTNTIFESYTEKSPVKKTISYIGKILSPILNMQNANSTQISFKIRDFLSVFEWVIRIRRKYELFIGVESIYTCAGIVLKKIGLVQTVVYYVSDYSPHRYPQQIINWMYLSLDRFCCYHADSIWDVSSAMLPARLSTGLDKKRCRPVILVPNALFPKQITTIPVKKIPFSLVYAGTLGKENGPDIAIEAMSEIKRSIPETTLHIFGGGERLDELKTLAKKLSLEKHIIFHGFVANALEISQQIKQYMIGLAPYMPIPGSARLYADATKIRLYLGAGLPVITTNVPPLGKVIQEKGAAVITDSTSKAFALSVIKLFNDPAMYKTMQQKGLVFAKDNTWEKVYTEALNKLYNSPDFQ